MINGQQPELYLRIYLRMSEANNFSDTHYLNQVLLRELIGQLNCDGNSSSTRNLGVNHSKITTEKRKHFRQHALLEHALLWFFVFNEKRRISL